MASSADRPQDRYVPGLDPQEIIACLPPHMVDLFERDWKTVLAKAGQSMDMSGINDLLMHWRHWAYQELRDPGSYDRLMAKAEAILATGHASPTSRPWAEVRKRIDARLAAEAGRADAG